MLSPPRCATGRNSVGKYSAPRIPILLIPFRMQLSQGDHDQAMSAYSTAARLLPGSHLPLLYIGMAQAQMNNLPLAKRYLERAMSFCGNLGSIGVSRALVFCNTRTLTSARGFRQCVFAYE